MQLNLIKKEQLQTSAWSGGTTTQLAIFPKEAVYKNLDFIFRISTATIDTEESSFTSLTDVNRIIMVLNGEMTIQHTNQYKKRLAKFDTDSFLGSWVTTSFGKVTDFNVMTRGSAKATLAGFSLLEQSRKEFPLKSDVTAVYVFSGEVLAENTLLSQGEIILIAKENNNENFTLQALKNSDIVMTEIWF